MDELLSAFRAKCERRRPIVIASFPLDERLDSAGRGLEWHIDSDWPIDMVILTAPEAVAFITQTAVSAEGTVFAGAMSLPPDGDFEALVNDSATWLLLENSIPDKSVNARAALAAKLNVIVCVNDAQEVGSIVSGNEKLPAHRIVIAFRSRGACTPDEAQHAAKAIREELLSRRTADFRIVLAAPLDKSSVMEYMFKPDIDGILLENQDYTVVLGVLSQIAMHIGS